MGASAAKKTRSGEGDGVELASVCPDAESDVSDVEVFQDRDLESGGTGEEHGDDDDNSFNEEVVDGASSGEKLVVLDDSVAASGVAVVLSGRVGDAVSGNGST